MRLKSYLEGLGDLTLSWLRRLLRSHYQEKSATEFYRKIHYLTREFHGNPQNFPIRTLDSRQKILFVSK
ncbi:unnamed protein product [Porites lobata]|uniref:Uncharacterized protein n=1 Tax=Porites lobata TaxID=104759 RepID=A0ABN8S5Z4_9CNID|nr:unnamed protein product [Porites lobata]